VSAILEVRGNSRQIPRLITYTSDKRYNDRVYGYMQLISIMNLDGTRYVKAKEVSDSALEKALKISRPTAKKYRVGLQELGLLGEKEDGKFQLTLLANEYATLVPEDVLEAIVWKESRYLVSLYVYCIGRYLANNEDYFPYSLNTVKEFIGIATNTYSNSHIISDNMRILDDLGLVTFKQLDTMHEGAFTTIQTIGNVRNRLQE
jgi:hypothetical protein